MTINIEDMQEVLELERSCEMKQHELAMMEKTMEASHAMHIIKEVATLRNSIDNIQKEMETAKLKAAEAQRRVDEIERDMAELSENREGKLAKINKQLAHAKKQSDTASVRLREVTTAAQGASLELGMLQLQNACLTVTFRAVGKGEAHRRIGHKGTEDHHQAVQGGGACNAR